MFIWLNIIIILSGIALIAGVFLAGMMFGYLKSFKEDDDFWEFAYDESHEPKKKSHLKRIK